MKILALTLSLATLTVTATARADYRVIGTDNRTQITARNYRPIHNSIGLIRIVMPGVWGLCTGTVISKRHIITAAHCLVDKGEFVREASFIPGMTGDLYTATRPFGTFHATKLRIIKNYISDEKTNNDLGLITVSKDLPVRALPLGMVPLKNKYVTITGYPMDKIEGTMWEAVGIRRMGVFGLRRPEHEVDTMAGQSGAAVRTLVRGVETIVGIHSAGVKTSKDEYNLALFFTPSHLKLIKAWIEKDK